VAKLEYALDLKSSEGNLMRVQSPPSPPNKEINMLNKLSKKQQASILLISGGISMGTTIPIFIGLGILSMLLYLD
jgi:hypothetical protein